MQQTVSRTRIAQATQPLPWYKRLGPGLITGAADDDPSGIATYSQAGALFGFGLLWTMVLAYPLMAAVQEISARIGRTTGKGLAGNIIPHYPPPVVYGLVGLLFMANIVNIGANLGAMGDAVALLIGGPRLLYVVAFGIVCTLMDAILCFVRTQMDVLVLEDFILERSGIPPLWDLQAQQAVVENTGSGAVGHLVYTLL